MMCKGTDFSRFTVNVGPIFFGYVFMQASRMVKPQEPHYAGSEIIAKFASEMEIADTDISARLPVGRFAPSPTGRMHLGNIFTALMSWLSVRLRGGRWILRIEDLDPQRSRPEYARLIEDDLAWLGLDWDEGGTDGRGPNGPYMQSRRHDLYEHALDTLRRTGLTYPCFCTRADIMATQAPHAADGLVIYPGTCRPRRLPSFAPEPSRPHAVRIAVPDAEMEFTDRIFGPQKANLARDCGDFVLRRADGAWAYQLAVVVDDALMGVTEVVRGHDLLASAARQTYLYRLLDYPTPEWAHLPLICNAEGRRLSKRDKGIDMEALRRTHTPEQLLGRLAAMAGIIGRPEALSAADLIPLYRDPLPRPCILLP